MKIDLNTSLKNNIHENSLTKTMKKQKMIVNKSLYCDWRFNGCSDDWLVWEETNA